MISRSCSPVLMAFMFALFGCYAGREQPERRSDQSRMRIVQDRLSAIRGLKFTSDVPISLQSRANLQKIIASNFQERRVGDTKREDVALAYAKLGLMGREARISGDLSGSFSRQALGFYDPQRGKVFVTEARQKSHRTQTIARSQGADVNVLVHELAHVLQDQNFSIGLGLRQPRNGDRTLALRSVAEGDAMLAEIAYEFGGLFSWVADFARERVERAGLLSGLPDLPEFVADRVRFQYVDGMRFVSRFVGKHGWRLIDLIYQYPPISTEQILHPDKYFHRPDPPTQIDFAGLSTVISSGWREVENNTIGELGVRSLFKRFLGLTDARKIANGWDGDRFVAYRRGDDVGFIWATAWDTSANAQEFFENYKQIASMKGAVRAAQGPHLYIEKRDRIVLVIEGLELIGVSREIQDVWQAMRTQEEPFQPPPFSDLLPVP